MLILVDQMRALLTARIPISAPDRPSAPHLHAKKLCLKRSRGLSLRWRRLQSLCEPNESSYQPSTTMEHRQHIQTAGERGHHVLSRRSQHASAKTAQRRTAFHDGHSAVRNGGKTINPMSAPILLAQISASPTLSRRSPQTLPHQGVDHGSSACEIRSTASVNSRERVADTLSTTNVAVHTRKDDPPHSMRL